MSALSRRSLLAGAGAATLLSACATPRPFAASEALPVLRATPDRITKITVCTRPFRAEGPRLETERLKSKTIVHHYGHGGSGWSLSWGSGEIARELALGAGSKRIGVIGAGAIGLTTALLLQRAGAEVTIYAKELPPDVPSSYASGVWSPDSRIAFESAATPAFQSRWQAMTRRAFAAHQNYLGLPGDPVQWIDSYIVRDPDAARPAADPRSAFASLRRALVPELSPRAEEILPGDHPFGRRTVRRTTFMMFNIGAYSRLLLADFLALGGRIRIAAFASVRALDSLPERTLVNCTGYGARALFGDTTLTPVRGQLARMIPQPDIAYGLYYRQVSFLPRKDGMVFQVVGPNDYFGFGDATAVPDRAEAERAVATIASLFPAPA